MTTRARKHIAGRDEGSEYREDGEWRMSPVETQRVAHEEEREQTSVYRESVDWVELKESKLSEKLADRVLLDPSYWRVAWDERSSLYDKSWLDLSVLNFCLMHSAFMHRGRGAIHFVDAWTLESCINDRGPQEEEDWISRYRELSGMPPAEQPCAPAIVMSFILRRSHFFVVIFDVASNTVYEMGRNLVPGLSGNWDEWDGPLHYTWICRLHGWEVPQDEPIREVVDWAQDGYNCGPLVFGAVESLFLTGLELNDEGAPLDVWRPCSHLSRIRMLNIMYAECPHLLQEYTRRHRNPDPLWNIAWDIEESDRFMEMVPRSFGAWPEVQVLRAQSEKCARCKESNVSVPAAQATQTEGAKESGGEEVIEAPTENSMLDRGVVLRTLPAKLTEGNTVDSTRFERRTMPVDLPAPKGKLWKAHNDCFDDYYGYRPSLEDTEHLRDREVLQNATTYYVPHATYQRPNSEMFIDYGFRLSANFAHIPYFTNPVLPERHVLRCGLGRDESEALATLHPSLESYSLTRNPSQDRTVEVPGVKVVGLQEMLKLAEDKDSSASAEKVFVAGQDPDTGANLVVDAELDQLDLAENQVLFRADIDSVIFVGRRVKVKKSVEVRCGPLVGTIPLAKSNHIDIWMLAPPTKQQRWDKNWDWAERRVGLSRIPHVQFIRCNKVSVLIMFPRMVHTHPVTGKAATAVPLDIQKVWWDEIVLPALHSCVGEGSKIYVTTTTEHGQRKTKTKGQKMGNINQIKEASVQPEELNRLFDCMEDRVKELGATNKVVAGFGSFFCMLESKGIKMKTVCDLPPGGFEEGEHPLKKMERELPDYDWEYLEDRKNGELYVDVAFSFNPAQLKTQAQSGSSESSDEREHVLSELLGEEEAQEMGAKKNRRGDLFHFRQPKRGKEPPTPAKTGEGVSGMWRLKCLEDSFGACGFNKGQVHHLNTLNSYGGIQAEMSAEREKRTHIVYRSAYNLVYETSRLKTNESLGISEGEAMGGGLEFLQESDERAKNWSPELASNCYGVRDEYRMTYAAAEKVLKVAHELVSGFYESRPILWIKTSVLLAFSSSERWGTGWRPNHGSITVLLCHLRRCITGTPIVTNGQIRDLLRAAQLSAIQGRFGMAFLSGWNPKKTNIMDHLPDRDPEEICRVVAVPGNGPRLRRKPPPVGSAPNLLHPLGSHPTWKTVQESISKNPFVLVKPFAYTEDWDSHEIASNLFQKFTRHVLNYMLPVHVNYKITNLKEAMTAWTLGNMYKIVQQIKWYPSSCALGGIGIGGQRETPFGQRREVFFHPVNTRVCSRGQWAVFQQKHGYIGEYWRRIKELPSEEVEKIHGALDIIFSYVQCLPPAAAPTENGSGIIWRREKSVYAVGINPLYLRLEGIRPDSAGIRRNQLKSFGERMFNTRATIEAFISREVIGDDRWNNREQRKVREKFRKGRSARRNNARVPPARKVVDNSAVLTNDGRRLVCGEETTSTGKTPLPQKHNGLQPAEVANEKNTGKNRARVETATTAEPAPVAPKKRPRVKSAKQRNKRKPPQRKAKDATTKALERVQVQETGSGSDPVTQNQQTYLIGESRTSSNESNDSVMRNPWKRLLGNRTVNRESSDSTVYEPWKQLMGEGTDYGRSECRVESDDEEFRGPATFHAWRQLIEGNRSDDSDPDLREPWKKLLGRGEGTESSGPPSSVASVRGRHGRLYSSSDEEDDRMDES
ncbi:hypothetical protein BXZ70DRAFT_911569 [Cristinia sonorae]|uniref:Ubiquitin-like protease family profile domain-containing protein n=1 Tax=Cristinia sonorae TaxID=1940300 RepID=A0A8K0UF12_9AGAR|nr:hypothetical protein BXZ70DRAFT_911569 [Cristinia sonorae]